MRWLLAAGPVAAAQMIAYVTIAGALRPGYRSERNWISQLVLGPGGWLAALNLAMCGLWLILCAAGLRQRLGPGAAARLVTWCGIGLLVIALVPTDPGIGYPPGVPTEATALGLAHQAFSVALGLTGVAAAALLGRATGRPRLGLLIATVMAVTFTAGSILVLLDAGGVLPGNPSGLLERIALYTGLCWIAWVSTALRRPTIRQPAAATTV
ncbi:MAG: DUF998 domain-containing protein [Actinoplanes sp.]